LKINTVIKSYITTPHHTTPPMNKSDLIQGLREHLKVSKMDHKVQVMKWDTLKEAHAYCLQYTSSQQFGPLIEMFIREKFGYTKNKAKHRKGDCSKDGKDSEVKASIGDRAHRKFNFVQIRPSHKCDNYILTAYHVSPENVEDLGELYIFRVSKTDIKNMIVSYGGYAHGTNEEHGAITIDSLNDETSTKEYALRPTMNDDCWKALMVFRISESEL